MIRNLKALGLALVAVFAMSAMAASAAQAETPAFLTTTGTSIDGSQIGEQTFTANGRTVTCKTANFTGPAPSNEGKTLTLTPTYAQCHSIILGTTFAATVTMNGCDYLFHGTKVGPAYTALADVVCPKDKKIEVHVYNHPVNHSPTTCTISVPAQTNKSTITLTNESSDPDDVRANVNVGSVTSEVHPAGFTCGTTHTTSATLKGEATLQATNALGEFVNLTVSG